LKWDQSLKYQDQIDKPKRSQHIISDPMPLDPQTPFEPYEYLNNYKHKPQPTLSSLW
jgi:hypothetical protein